MLQAAPSVSGSAPLVPVRDVTASVAFYTDALGFKQEVGNAAHGYALMRRDALMVSLLQTDDAGALNATANNVSAQLWMDDVAGYFDAIKDNFDAYPDQRPTPPLDRDYGVRELHIKDLDGFLMFFTDLKDFTKGA